jgi:DNA invertase Pin-like site-specific DNA recombinase
MMARIFGYARVSTGDQDLSLQVHALQGAGVGKDNIFTDVVTGAQATRPGITTLMAAVKEGDTIVVWRLDRLGRSLVHLADLAAQLHQRGVGIRSLTDGVDTSQATGRLIYGILSTLAEFERETIRTRVRAGMAAAKRAGVHCGRRPALKAEHVAHARERLASGEPARRVAGFLKVSEATLYRALARHPLAPPAAQ